MITVKDLRKVYKLGSEKVVALDDINVTIYTGEVCCILGTSGSGKSTLLNMLAGLERPTRGQVLIGKRDIARMDEASLAKFPFSLSSCPGTVPRKGKPGLPVCAGGLALSCSPYRCAG